jgi:hypothetical protein
MNNYPREQVVNNTTQEKKTFDNAPIIETNVSVSKDGKYVIHRTTITDIKPINFWNKVLGAHQ